MKLYSCYTSQKINDLGSYSEHCRYDFYIVGIRDINRVKYCCHGNNDSVDIEMYKAAFKIEP